jgi:L-serine/L-threonine ammonia-lyase
MNSPKFYIETPVYKSHSLFNQLGKNIFYKMECFQPTNSFKIRGMEELCKYHFNNGKRDFIISSGGNAGYSLAYVGYKLGVKVKVIVPETTTKFMIDKITRLGAIVDIHGKVWDEAHQFAHKHAKEIDAVYVSPFDDPLLWKGHSTIIDECAKQMEQPDTVIVSVGGGGLLCGILEGMKNNGWQETKIITAETFGAASFHKSYNAGKIVELEKITSIATSLAAKKITVTALEKAQEFNVIPFTMSDQDTIKASLKFLDEYSVLVEPACGASLSIPYFHSHLNNEDENVLVIVCGGANTQIRKYTSNS